jgi:hypothetical protein
VSAVFEYSGSYLGGITRKLVATSAVAMQVDEARCQPLTRGVDNYVIRRNRWVACSGLRYT